MVSTEPSAEPTEKTTKKAWKAEKHQAKMARRAQRRARKSQRRRERVVIRSRSLLRRDQAVELLDQIVAGLKAGSIKIEHEQQALTVYPEAIVDLAVTARETHKSQSLRIKIQWPRTLPSKAAMQISPDTGDGTTHDGATQDSSTSDIPTPDRESPNRS